ncbi:MobA/MobL family protein, partial [Xanthomonas phaseoli]
EDAPDWALVPAELWPAAEAAERRKDSTVAREFEFALPHELDDLQRSELAVEVTRALVGR